MKILKVEKDKVQVELTKEEIAIIKNGLRFAGCETGDEDYAPVEKEFEKVLSEMER